MRTNHARKIREFAVSPVIATILMVANCCTCGTLYVGQRTSLNTTALSHLAANRAVATDDNLAITTMTQGESIGWASLSIAVSVDGAEPCSSTADSWIISGRYHSLDAYRTTAVKTTKPSSKYLVAVKTVARFACSSKAYNPVSGKSQITQYRLGKPVMFHER